MESVRLKIHGHMTSVVGEDILCVLDKRGVKLDDVRVFVLERLSLAAEWMCSLFQREMETLETLLEKQNKLLDIDFDMDMDLHTAGMCVTHTHTHTHTPTHTHTLKEHCNIVFYNSLHLKRMAESTLETDMGVDFHSCLVPLLQKKPLLSQS